MCPYLRISRAGNSESSYPVEERGALEAEALGGSARPTEHAVRLPQGLEDMLALVRRQGRPRAWEQLAKIKDGNDAIIQVEEQAEPVALPFELALERLNLSGRRGGRVVCLARRVHEPYSTA